jgi:two-component system chemotaxis sensor kinase CheA
MNRKGEHVDHTSENGVNDILCKISAQLQHVEKKDLTNLTNIFSDLQNLCSIKSYSKQFTNLAKQASKLAETILLNDVPFESGCKRLTEGISKMHDLAKMPNFRCSFPAENVKKYAAETENIKPDDIEQQVIVLEDAADLVDKFITSIQSVLEDLEGKALSLENGSSEELSAIKRILHTMKGEFGVLNLQAYASLIHRVEAAIENNEFSSENMLRLKDVLGKKILQYADNRFPGINDEERKYIFENKIKTALEESSCSSSLPPNGNDAISNQDSSLLSDFITESRDHIHNAECLLLELEADQGKTEHLNSIFRACHTIKGVASFLSLKDVASLAHAIENLMDLTRQEKITLNSGLIDLLLGSMDCLKEFIAHIESYIKGKPYKKPENYFSIMERLSNAISEKTGLQKKLIGEILIEKGHISEGMLENALQIQKQGDKRKIGQILVQENNVSEKKINDALNIQKGIRLPKNVEETVRVPVARLDQLIDAIGEAVIAQSMVTADPAVKGSASQSLHTKINQANMIMRQIQELSMSMRMVSVKSTFQKMARLVRDLSKKSGKQVEFLMEGEDTEIDKIVVEHIGDPLIHMIRNSIDHGIETVAEREANGKSPVACITLKAYHKAGNVFIEIWDDGRGLDKESILNKAIERGLCKPGDKLSDQEIYDFIFQPGFSTAKQITDISGRGVGMDVVKKNIDALRGSIEIHTEKGKGTTFTIRLPLTLAIIDGMVVRVCESLYIVPTLSIVETIAARDDMIESVLNAQKMIRVRSDHLPLVYLSQLFAHKTKQNTQSVALIVEDALGKRAAIMVDEIIGQQQVVIKNIGNGVIDVPGISGGAIMSDGTVSLILDINGILKNVVDR